MIVGSGIDLVEIHRIQQSVDRFGARFLDRVYTEAEQRYCMAKRNAAESLARIPGAEVVQESGGRYAIRGAGERLITDVIRCVSENRIAVTDFRTEMPNLEDVFLQITGHSLRD